MAGPPIAYLIWIGLLSTGTLVVGLILARGLEGPNDLETSWREAARSYAVLADWFGTGTLRLVSAVAAAVSVALVAEAARRLLHSAVVGAVAATLFALEPSTLIGAASATPQALVASMAAAGLLTVLMASPASTWAAALPLSVAVALQPAALLWCLAAFAVAAFRGHIYAAGAHMVMALSSTLAIPALVGGGAAALSTLRDGRSACTVGLAQELSLRGILQTGDGTFWLHNPILWYGGMIAAVALGAAAMVRVVSGVRMARQPGRVQFRLPGRLAREHGRALWILVLVAGALTDPTLLPGAAAIALAFGTARLGQDAPGFSIPLHAALLGFSAMYLVRLWPLLVGDGGEIASLLLPWSDAASCSS